ncbi:MAG: hypothetical protein LUO89_01030 [Methanothrix sp.]|nr:hypothetical protein [Methanothrix sp.]
MKWTVLIIAIMMLLCTALCTAASGQLPSYSTIATGGAPTPSTPSSAESLGLQAPAAETTYQQAPTVQEKTQTLISASQEAAYASAPQGLGATATSPVYNKVIVPSGGYAPNGLYISYATRTIASCNLYANLPLWMKISGTGNIWFYEWYPNGMLDTQYAGYVYYPNWYKRWFYADVPGWHILQYYCNGWSNYAYIYVYGPSSYWVNPNPSPEPVPYPYPYWDSQITYTYPPTGHTYYSNQWTTTKRD